MNTTPRPTASEKLCAGQIESAPISQRSLATGLRSSAVSASFIIAINEIRRRQSADFVAFFIADGHDINAALSLLSPVARRCSSI